MASMLSGWTLRAWPYPDFGMMASCPLTSSYPGHCETTPASHWGLGSPARAMTHCLHQSGHCTTSKYMELLVKGGVPKKHNKRWNLSFLSRCSCSPLTFNFDFETSISWRNRKFWRFLAISVGLDPSPGRSWREFVCQSQILHIKPPCLQVCTQITFCAQLVSVHSPFPSDLRPM